MLLFYPLRNGIAHHVLPPCYVQIYANWHLRESATRFDDVITLRNALRHMTVAAVQHREVLCITKGLCIVGRYKCEAPINKKSVVVSHA
jgi:hypothetical protein